MKNVLISLVALAALSGTALASDYGQDLRDSDTYVGKYSTQNNSKGYASETEALVVVKSGNKKLTAFERMMKNSEENETGHGYNH